MFIELIDLLRCINAHEDTWLVASFKTVSNRFVLEASLGCPSCSAHYPVREGIADFSAGAELEPFESERSAASHRREELATRAGAYLDATEPGATIVLGGVWAYAAQELSMMAEVRVLALNAPVEVKESETVGLLRVESKIPVAPGSVFGVALDAWFPEKIIESAVRAVRPGGRIVGPATIPAPAELSVLAHDDNYWVAQKAPEVVTISRASR
ncbi:MAG TPA: hypothetical protein VGO75_03705 [Gemmatimonadaceae bacterium]|nr:hypothetical protein [Gemmatimonadaceae bacterium]